jgi:hypothetical protein
MAFLNVSQDERALFQNEACLVINKRPGESSEFPDLDEAPAGRFFPVHRLDTPVSGCLLLAKTQVAAALLGSAFAGKEYKAEKRYWAVVEMPQKEIPAEAELVHWITENKKANKAFAYDVEEIPRDGLSGGGGRRGNARPQKAVCATGLSGRASVTSFWKLILLPGGITRYGRNLPRWGFM